MIVKKEYPPNYSDICATFNIKGRPGVIFTHGDTIYNPTGVEITYDLRVHEETHERQQKLNGPDAWWEKYLADPQFRIAQELEAYRMQWLALQTAGREHRRKMLRGMAAAMAGPIYGSVMTKDRAKALICGVQ